MRQRIGDGKGSRLKVQWYLLAMALACGCGIGHDVVDERFEQGLRTVGVVHARPAAAPLLEASEGRLKPGERLRIGAWNIQWLDSPDERGRPPQRARDLADYIAASRVDALGLSEIGANVVDGASQSATLNEVVDLLAGTTGGKWRYLLFPNADDDLRQHVGVMWNADRVQMLGWMPAEIDRSGDARIWHRHPVGVKLSAGRGLTDVVVIPIHMKCCLAADQRAEEARTLLAAMPALRSYFRDDDVLIIGDANMFDADETAGRLYRDAGFIDLNRMDRATHVTGIPFDRAYVPPQPEFAGARMAVFGKEFMKPRRLKAKHFQDRYSDHLLIWVDVKVMPDDD